MPKLKFDTEAAADYYAMGGNPSSSTLMGVLAATAEAETSVTLRGSCLEAMATLCAALPRETPGEFERRYEAFHNPENRSRDIRRALGKFGVGK